jgi:predicted lipoprotein with Yx(FWY)xxD motif
VHATTKTAVAGERPAASVIGRRRRRRLRRELLRLGGSVAGLAAVALVAAACTGGGSSPGAGSYGTGAMSSGSPAAVVDLRGSRLGRILVDGRGRTLYLFEADKAGRSACNGACAGAWPPYLSNGTPQAGSGVAGALLGTSVRSGDGGTQVTYHGHPLYYYAGDGRPGDTTGQGLNQFGAKWYVLAASGNKIDND